MNLGSIKLKDFSGGLHTKAGPGEIEDNELSESFNCYLVHNAVAKRKGYTRYNNSARISTTNFGVGIIYAPFVDGEQIIGIAGTKVAKKGTATWTDITGTVTITSDKPVINCMINNNLVCVNGVNNAWYYSGSGNATVLNETGMPTAPSVCESFHGRLFLAEGRNLYWSQYMGDWNKEFSPDDNQPFEDTIKGLKILGDSNTSNMLIILKNGGVYTCTFTPEVAEAVGGRGSFTFNQISERDGCVSANTVKECVTKTGDSIVIWADSDGLKACDVSGKIVKLTDKIQPDWDNINKGQLSNSCAVYYKKKNWYIFIYADSDESTHNRCIIYDLERWCIVGIFDWAISIAGTVIEGSEEKLIGSDYSGYWNHYDNGQNDNDSAIDAYFKTKAIDGGDFIHDKGWFSLGLQYAYYGAFDLDITIYMETVADTFDVTNTIKDVSGAILNKFILDQDVLGVQGQLISTSEEIRGWGRQIQMKIGNSNADEPFRIHVIEPRFEIGKPIMVG